MFTCRSENIVYLFPEVSTCWRMTFPRYMLTLLKVKAETCPQHVEGEVSCPRVILIFGCLQGVLWKGIILTSPPNGLPTHASNWQLYLKEFTRRKLLEWWSFLWFMHRYKNSWFSKRKKCCGNFLNNFFLLLNKLGKDPNEGGCLCWIIKG